MSEVVIREMNIGHYDAMLQLLTDTPGVTIRDADSKQAVEKYLQRNPGLSLVALDDDQVVGCVMCGHDGRRGYLNHLVVREPYREQGIGSKLVDACLSRLQHEGIGKVHIDVIIDNDIANRYWPRHGWKLRTDINRYSFICVDSDNA